MGNYLKMSSQQQIETLLELGWTNRRIARELGVHRETVGRYARLRKSKLANPIAGSEDWPRGPDQNRPNLITGPEAPHDGPAQNRPNPITGPPSSAAAHHEYIEKELKRGLTAQRIWQDLVEQHGYNHGYLSVQRYARRLKGRHPELADHMEHPPGDEGQIDFFKSKAPVCDPRTGRRAYPWVFRMTLSCSRHGYEEALPDQKGPSFMRAHEHAFLQFGGLPRVVRMDNTKTAVTRACFYDPDLNELYGAFAGHWGFIPLPSRPRHPQEQGVQERSGGYVNDNALKGRSFESLEELNEFLRRWNRHVAQQRIHGSTRRQVLAHFLEVEQPALRPLPGERFQLFETGRRRVHFDGYVEVDSRRGSPHTAAAQVRRGAPKRQPNFREYAVNRTGQIVILNGAPRAGRSSADPIRKDAGPRPSHQPAQDLSPAPARPAPLSAKSPPNPPNLPLRSPPMNRRPRPSLLRSLAAYGVLGGLWLVPPLLLWPPLLAAGSRPTANALAWPLAVFQAALDGSIGLEPWRWLAAAPPPDPGRFWAVAALESVVLVAMGWIPAKLALATGRSLPTASRWARPWDLSRAGLMVRRAHPLRLVLGRLGALGFVATRPGVSLLVFGPTGSGKSAGVCVPQILEWDGPVLAVSIKNDLVVQTAGHRQRLGRTDVFDPTGITGLGTCTWSPVSRCEDFDRALRVGQWLVQGQNGYAHRDAEWEHWEDAAIRLVTTALYAGASLRAPIAEVISWLDDVSGSRLGSALSTVPGRDRRALQWYHSVQERPDRERGSCYSTSQKVLRPYIEREVAASADGESFDPRELLRSGSGTLYLVAPQSEQARLSGVFTSLVMTLMTDAADIAQSRPDGRLPRPLLVMLDECANTAPIRELPQYLSTVRSMGVTLVAIFQDLAQCEARYGELASSIVNNARAVLFLSGSKDRKTLELQRDLTGRQRQRRYTQDNSGGEQLAFEKDEMLPVDVGRRLGPRRGLLLYEHLPPVVLRTRNCYQDRDLRRLGTRERFIPGVTEVLHSSDQARTPSAAAVALDP